jgi:hypothetical protein
MVFREVTGKKKQQKQLELPDRLTSLGTMAFTARASRQCFGVECQDRNSACGF